MSRRLAMILVAACLHGVVVARGEGDEVPWEAFRPLVGRWSGEGSGFGNISDVVHEWEFVIQGRFLRLQTRSVPHGDGALVHEDVGFLSHDADRGAYAFRQFLSEGFVNTFDVFAENGETAGFLFEARESEGAGGMRVRMRLRFLSDAEYEMVLELAMPDEDFVACQRMEMKKAG